MLSREAVAEIKAAQDVYRASDVARAYSVHRSTIKRIWDGTIHTNANAADTFPDIACRPRAVDVEEDIRILLSRGYTPKQVAKELGVGERAVYEYKGIYV